MAIPWARLGQLALLSGQAYLENKAQRADQRALNRAMDRQRARQQEETNFSNLVNAFGGRSTPMQVPLSYRGSDRANTLRSLGQIAGLGSQAIGMYQGLSQAERDAQAQDLQNQNLRDQIDIRRGTLEASGIPLSAGKAAGPIAVGGGAMGPVGPSGAGSRTAGATLRMGDYQAPPSLSQVGQAAFNAQLRERRTNLADAALLRRAQEANIAADNALAMQRIASIGSTGTTYSGSNKMQMAGEIGSNFAFMNPLASQDEIAVGIKNFAEASGITLTPELTQSAIKGYNAAAAGIREDYVGALDGAVKVAVDQGYEAGLLTLQSNLGTKYGEGFQISESLLGTYLDRLDAASDTLNLDGSTRKRLVEMMAIRENALNAIDKLTDDKVYEQIKANFGRDSGAVARAKSFFTGEAKVLGDDAASFLNQLGFLTDTVARFRSGAALTESEQTFYGRLIGSLYTRPEDLRLNLQGLVNQMNTEINTTLSVGGKKRLSDFNG